MTAPIFGRQRRICDMDPTRTGPISEVFWFQTSRNKGKVKIEKIEGKVKI